MKKTFSNLLLLLCISVSLSLSTPTQLLAKKKAVVITKKKAVVVTKKKAVVIAKKIDVNTASKKQLCKIPGVGLVTALRILVYRTEKNGFKKLTDLTKIKGIGEKILKKMKPYIQIKKGLKVKKLSKAELKQAKTMLASKPKKKAKKKVLKKKVKGKK